MKKQTPKQIEAELIALKKQIQEKKGAEEVIKNNAKEQASKDKEALEVKTAKDIVYQALNKAMKSGVYDLKESATIINAFEKLM